MWENQQSRPTLHPKSMFSEHAKFHVFFRNFPSQGGPFCHFNHNTKCTIHRRSRFAAICRDLPRFAPRNWRKWARAGTYFPRVWHQDDVSMQPQNSLKLLLSSGIPTRACLPFVTLARNGVWALHHARHASCRGHASCAPFKRPFCHYLLHVRQHVHYERRSAVGATLRGGRGKLRGHQ